MRRKLCKQTARDSLVSFMQYTWPGYIPGRHHYLIAEYLETVERTVTQRLRPGEEPIDRLIINMPPRHGKSHESTVNFPAWFLGRNPDMRVIDMSYSDTLASEFSGMARDICASPEYVELGFTPPSKSSRSKDRWNIAGRRGGLKSAGRGSAVTGLGGNILIIDDPTKDAEEAMSPVIQQKTLDWFESTARTRLAPHGAIIIILTRWHKNDLAGQVLRQMENGGKTKWKSLVLPAIAEVGDPLGRAPGEALWPEMYPVSALEEMMDSPWWMPLFQQHPQDPKGSLFQREWFSNRVNEDPGCEQYVRFWDCAAKTSERNDFTAALLMGRVGIDRYALDLIHERLNYPAARQRIIDTAMSDPPGTFIAIEDTSNGQALIQDLRDDPLMGSFTIVPVTVTVDKSIRAAPASAAAKGGHFYLKNAPWVNEFIEELCSFPMGEHDDIVDAVSGANSQLYGPTAKIYTSTSTLAATPAQAEHMKMETEARKKLSPELMAHVNEITRAYR